MSKYVTLEVWAREEFDPTPPIASLRRWAREGRIDPEPLRIGNTYYVARGSKYRTPAPAPRGRRKLVDRINDAQAKKRA